MNSNERVHTVIRGGIPDRVPIGEFAIDFDTVEKILGRKTYLRAKAASQLAFWEGRHEEVAQSWIEDHIALHEKLDLDIVHFAAATYHIPDPTDEPPPRRVDGTTWRDRRGRVYKYSDITADFTVVEDPVADAAVYRADDFRKEPGERRLNALSRKVLRAVTERFKGRKFILGPNAGESGIPMLGGLTRGLLEIADNLETVQACAEYFIRDHMANEGNFIQPDHDAIMWGQDFAFKTGPFCSPVLFREVFLPHIKQHVAHIRKTFGKPVFKHACGNNWALLDAFVEAGYACYQSIQPTAEMDLARVKARIGDRMTLWGGVPVEEMVGGTPDQVRASVRRALEVGKPGGRFILGTSHSIAVGSRYDNFMAMLDEHAKRAAY